MPETLQRVKPHRCGRFLAGYFAFITIPKTILNKRSLRTKHMCPLSPIVEGEEEAKAQGKARALFYRVKGFLG